MLLFSEYPDKSYISQINTLILPYFISYYSSTFIINQFHNHEAKCTLHSVLSFLSSSTHQLIFARKVLHLAPSWKLEFLELGNGLFMFSNFYLFFSQKTAEEKEESSGKKTKNKTDKRKTEQGDDEDKDAEDYEDGEAEKEAPETEEDEEEDETDDKIEEMKKPKRKAAEEDESDLDSSRYVKSSLLIKSTYRSCLWKGLAIKKPGFYQLF